MRTPQNPAGKGKRSNNINTSKWTNLTRIVEIGYKCISTLSILIHIIDGF